MKRVFVAMIAVAASCASAIAQQATVETKGQKTSIKLEHVVSGHLKEINGKYKLRVTEAWIEPGGYVREHQHVGPGIRVVMQGEMTLTEEGKVTVYKAGDAFYESGGQTTAAENRSGGPATVLSFELLPVAHSGGSAIPPPK